MKILFDLRDYPEHHLVQCANKALLTSNSPYLHQYGAIASEQWWRLYEVGQICRSRLVGQIVHLGIIKDDFNELWDIVRIQTDQGDIEYDREDFWLDSCVTVNKWVYIEKVSLVVPTSSGPTTYQFDVQVGVQIND